MNIIVCVKYAKDVDELKIDSQSGSLLTSNTSYKVSDTDKNAVEEAVRIKERQGGKIATLTFGPPETKEGLKEILAMGADESYIVEDPSKGELDTLTTSYVLATAVAKLGNFDLIMCGEATIDTLSYQVGPRLAERLGMPQLVYVKKVNVNGNTVEVERELEDSYEVVRANMPVLISVARGINEPRIPTLMSVLKASKKKIEYWKIDDLGLSQNELTERNNIQQLEVRPLEMKRKGMIIKDKPPQEAADELATMLVKERCIGG